MRGSLPRWRKTRGFWTVCVGLNTRSLRCWLSIGPCRRSHSRVPDSGGLRCRNLLWVLGRRLLEAGLLRGSVEWLVPGNDIGWHESTPFSCLPRSFCFCTSFHPAQISENCGKSSDVADLWMLELPFTQCIGSVVKRRQLISTTLTASYWELECRVGDWHRMSGNPCMEASTSSFLGEVLNPKNHFWKRAQRNIGKKSLKNAITATAFTFCH